MLLTRDIVKHRVLCQQMMTMQDNYQAKNRIVFFPLSFDDVGRTLKATLNSTQNSIAILAIMVLRMIIHKYKEVRTWMKIMQGRTRAGYCALTRSWHHLPPLDPGNLDTGANGRRQY